MPNTETSRLRVWLPREPAGWHDVVIVPHEAIFVAQLVPGYGTLNGKGASPEEAVRRLQLEIDRIHELLDEANEYARQRLARESS